MNNNTLALAGFGICFGVSKLSFIGLIFGTIGYIIAKADEDKIASNLNLIAIFISGVNLGYQIIFLSI